MNEEMRKDFSKEYYRLSGCEVLFDDYGTPYIVSVLEVIVNTSVQSAWWGWKKSREAMKPIKLPPATFETPSGDNALREDAVIDAIYAAGYRVAP